MKNWATKPLGDLVEERTERLRGDSATIYSVTNERGFVRSLDLFDKQVFSADTGNYKRVGFQDLAYNPSRINVGSIAMLEDKKGGAVSPMYVIVRCKSGLHPTFLLHFLKSDAGLHQINQRCEGAVRFQLKFRDLCVIPILVPPLTEQERILNLLDEADELRKVRTHADTRTAALLPALFSEMFGNPQHTWGNLTLGELVEDFRYGTSNKSTGQGKPTLRIPNVVGEAINLDDLKFVPVTNAEFERLQMKDGDLLFVRTNGNADNVGRCAVFDAQAIKNAGHNANEFIYASYLIRARLQTGRVMPLFVQNYLTSSEGCRALRARSKTSAGQFNINTEGLGTIPIPIPPLPLQKEFALRVTEIREMEAAQSVSRQSLEALFQSMLHCAFNGEL
jgi:type I restriction enzyme S subunit